MSQDILYSTGKCVLGVVLVAASERGVCAILLGEQAGALERDLQARFPQASLRNARSELEPMLSKVTDSLAALAAGFDLPLDPQGSDFERRVWRAVREIPAGTTQT